MSLGARAYHTGSTTVQGSLVVDGEIVYSPVTVAASGTLSGYGTLNQSLNVYGTVAPGDGFPSVLSPGPTTFFPGSTLLLAVNKTRNAVLDVSGLATLGGILAISFEEDAERTGTGLAMHASGGFSGGFDAVYAPGYTIGLSPVGDRLFFTWSLNYLPTSSLSGNAKAIARYLNENAPANVIVLAGYPGALQAISPSRNAFGAYTSAQTAFSLSGLISQRMDSSRPSKEKLVALLASEKILAAPKEKAQYSAWITGFQEFARQGALAQNPAFNFITEAVLGGIDWQGADRSLVGAATGYAHTHYYDHGVVGSGTVNYYFASLYGNVFVGQFYFSPAVWGFFNQFATKRNIKFAGFSATATSTFCGWQTLPHLELGYKCNFSWGTLSPFTAADWAVLWQRQSTEKHAEPFNAKTSASRSSMLRSETGLKFYETWRFEWGDFVLQEKASYIFERPFSTGTVNSAFVGIPGSFTVVAVNQNLNLASISLDMLFRFKASKVRFSYEGEFGSKYWSNEYDLTLSRDF